MSGDHDPLGFLRELAIDAGAQMLEARRRMDTVKVDAKGPVDLVTEVDLALERMIVGRLREAFPEWAVVSEEGTARDEVAARPCWYVDPLDGTTNFVHGHPFYAVSIGGWIDDQPVAGVVYAPALDEMFLASPSHGASLERPVRGGDPQRLRLRVCGGLNEALLATGFPYRRDETCRLNLRCVGEALVRSRGVRRGGSAALDLCYLAAGRLDGFWEPTLRPWDVAAGAIVAREAGARISDYRGGPRFLWERRIVAAGETVHGQLLAMLREAHQQPEEWPLGRALEGPAPLDRLPGEEGL